MIDERILMLDESIRVINGELQRTKTKLLDKFKEDPKFAKDVEDTDEMIDLVLYYLFK